MNVRALNERIGELEEEVRQLRAALMPSLPRIKGLQRRTSSVLALLLARAPNVVARETILAYVFGDERELSCVNIAIHKLRRTPAPHGVQIRNEWGRGYYLDTESAKRLRALFKRAP
ncbi:MAG: winged helix-turn-helix domain-containing protein [Methylocystis sp.]